jgi:hypothetical protein
MYMNHRLSLLLLASALLISGGCIDTESLTAYMESESEDSSCQTLDYGIREFNLQSSLPILSNSHDVRIVVAQIGDCEASALTVSIYEDERLVSQHEIEKPIEFSQFTVDWTPNKNTAVTLQAKIELLDDDTENNSEEIIVQAYPLGNYLSISDLSADIINASSTRTEMFTVVSPIHISDIKLYLKKSEDSQEEVNIKVKLSSDDNGKPGTVLKEVEHTIKPNDQFDWFTIPLEQVTNAGNYWLTVSSKDADLLWHYSRREMQGSEQVLLETEYKINSSTAIFIKDAWELLPEKDYTYKIYAGGADESSSSN